MVASANPFSALPMDDSAPDDSFDEFDSLEDPEEPEADAGYAKPAALDAPPDMDDDAIIQILNGYFEEAENARETGFEPRHDVWEQNLHAFWMRKDFPDKRKWQSKEKSAYIPNFVERFAAGLREALTSNPNWATVEDRYDESDTLSAFATKLTRIALDFAGTNASGQAVKFEHDFGNHVLTGALMKMCCAVTWDSKNGRVQVGERDPRQTYHDPTGRGLYRVSFWEADKESMLRMADEVDADGNPIYDAEAIEQCVAQHDMDIVQNQEDSSGSGQMLTSARTPILIKEWFVDIIDNSKGKAGQTIVAERQLIVVANDRHIIRGPEKNPYWSGKDWVVAHPVLQSPLKHVDGRTYVETFRQAVETHENVTNRVLDAFTMSSLNAFEVDPDCMDDPTVVEDGISPNMTIIRDADAPDGKKAIQAIELGKMTGSDASQIWQATRRDAQEAGSQSDLSLGQTARGETTATEAQLSNAGQSSLQNSIAIDIDIAYLAPIVELVYYCALQHVGPDSGGIWAALSPDEQQMLMARRAEFKSRPITVRASGLTNAVKRKQRIRGTLGALNVIGSNPILVAEFQKEYSIGKLVKLILEDFDVPVDELKLSPEAKFARDDKLRQQNAITEAQQAMGAPPQPGGGAPGAPAQPTDIADADPMAAGAAEGLDGGIR